MRKPLGTILKISITVLALFYVSTQVDFADIGQRLLQANLGWVLVGFLLFNLSLVVRAYRWLLLLRGIGETIRFQRLVSLYFAANFFNSLLPLALAVTWCGPSRRRRMCPPAPPQGPSWWIGPPGCWPSF